MKGVGFIIHPVSQFLWTVTSLECVYSLREMFNQSLKACHPGSTHQERVIKVTLG